MRDRVLLGTATAALLFVGALAAVVKGGDDHVGPAACALRVASVLHIDAPTEPSVSEDGDAWVASLPSGRLVLRVTGKGSRVTGVEALAGPGADVLERPERLRGLAVQC